LQELLEIEATGHHQNASAGNAVPVEKLCGDG
jgi:hypothetical protein